MNLPQACELSLGACTFDVQLLCYSTRAGEFELSSLVIAYVLLYHRVSAR